MLARGEGNKFFHGVGQVDFNAFCRWPSRDAPGFASAAMGKCHPGAVSLAAIGANEWQLQEVNNQTGEERINPTNIAYFPS